jgi:GT2 family glycosyltransferase
MKNKINAKVSIIILNWNGWKDTIECLESLYKINYPNYDVILVDNNSEDDSIEKIHEYCEDNIKIRNGFFSDELLSKATNSLKDNMTEFEEDDFEEFLSLPSNRKLIIIANPKNYGFTKGNNIGMEYATNNLKPDYFLLLNNDTIVDKDFLYELVKNGEINKKTGFLSPKIYFYDYKGDTDIIQYAGAKQNLWIFNPEHIGIFQKDIGKYDKICTTDYAHGSCVLAKVEMINEIGYLDEDYFSYREENDWGIRGKIKGWDSLYIPKSKIWHKGGKSTGGNFSPMAIFYRTRNDFIFMKKNGNTEQNISFLLYFIFFKLWFFCSIYLLYYQDLKVVLAFLKGFKEGLLWRKNN